MASILRFGKYFFLWVTFTVLLMTTSTNLESMDSSCDVMGPGAVTSGDINVALLLDVHSSVAEKCGDLNPSAVQELEAVNFVFSRLNEGGYIPGIKLGTVAYDTCSLLARTAGSLRHLKSVLDNRYVPNGCNNNTKTFFGIVGPSTSPEAIVVANNMEAEFSTNRLLQISHSATASVVTPDDEFTSSFRVVPPDDLQAKVIVDLLRRLDWNYAGLIFTDDTYGQNGADIILKLAKSSEICFAFVEKIPAIPSEREIQTSLNLILMYGGNARPKASGVVFFGSTPGAVIVLQVAETYKEKIHFIFSDSVQFRPDIFSENRRVSGGVLVVEPTYRRLGRFEQYLREVYTNASRLIERAQQNPWLEELYREKTNCPPTTSLESCSPLDSADVKTLSTTSLFTYYITRVAYIYAKLIKDLHTACMTSRCTSLQTVSRELIRSRLLSMDLNFKDEFGPFELDDISEGFSLYNLNGSPSSKTIGSSSVMYEVKNFQRGSCNTTGKEFCFIKVGSFDGKVLTLDLSRIKHYDLNQVEIDRVISQCPPGDLCEACLNQHPSKEWVYIPGDVIIVGLAPVYNSGESAFSCSDIRPEKGLQLAEAIIFAVGKINQKQGIFSSVFPGKTVGALIMNTCYSKTVSQKGTLSVFFDNDPYLVSKVSNVSSKIIGFVGPLRSDVAESVASLLTQLKFTMISYGSTSVSLSDRQLYPYFCRTCAADDTQGKVIVLLLKDLGWKYFSIVYEGDAYGENGFKIIKNLSTQNDLCIAEAVEINPPTNYFKVLEQLRQSPSAGAVVLFVHSPAAQAILQAFSQKDDYTPGEFVFIMTESVGNRLSVIKGSRAAEGSLSLIQAVAKNAEFNSYLSKKMTSRDLAERLWFTDYWESILECYLLGSYNKLSDKPCPKNLSLTEGEFYQDPWAPFVVNSVYSLVIGASAASTEVCGPDGGWCSEVRNKPEAVLAEILKTRLDLFGTGSDSSVFDEAGNGVVGFKIVNVKPSNARELSFNEVGYWNQYEDLQLDKGQLVPSETSTTSFTCPNEVECERCQALSDTNTEEASFLVVPLSVSTGIVGFIALVLGVILVGLCCKRKGTHKSQTNESSSSLERRHSIEYLHAVDLYSSINEQKTDETTLSNPAQIQTSSPRSPASPLETPGGPPPPCLPPAGSYMEAQYVDQPTDA